MSTQSDLKAQLPPRPQTVYVSRSRKRDLSRAQLRAWMERQGIDTGESFLGYVALPHGLHVSVHNAGPRNRDKQAYLASMLKQDQWRHDNEAVLDAIMRAERAARRASRRGLDQ